MRDRKEIKRQIAPHRHVSKVRRQYVTERDVGAPGSWLLDGFRGFSSIWAIVITLRAKDGNVKGIVDHLIRDLKFKGPYSVLSAISASNRSCEEAVGYLAGHIATSINYRKASAIVALSVLSVMMDKIPDTYIDIVSLPWGPKCACEAMKEGFGCKDGVGCDIHMCRMYGELGWADPVTCYRAYDKQKKRYVTKEQPNHDCTLAQFMSWWPPDLISPCTALAFNADSYFLQG